MLSLKSTVCALDVPRAGGGSGLPVGVPILLISTQSGSGLGVKGLLGLFGFGKWSFEGGWIRERAGRPSKYQHKCKERREDEDTIVKPPLSAIRAGWWEARLN